MDAVQRSRFWLTAPALLVLALLAVGTGLVLLRGFPGLVPDTVCGMLVGVGVGLAFAAFLRWRLPPGEESCPPSVGRRYQREVLLGMSAYVILLFVSLSLLKHAEGTLLRAALALLPVPPIGLVLRAMVRFIRSTDEMQQRIELESVSIASAVVAMAYLTGGFLQLAKVIDVPAGAAMIWVFPALCGLYGLAKTVVSARYR
jgi:hypothetical protein